MNKLKYLGAGIALSLVLTGCSGDKNADKDEQAPTEVVEEENKHVPEVPTTELTVEQEVADELAEEEGVEEVNVQLETIGDQKYVNMDVKLNVMRNGEETAEAYAELLKEKYPDRIADIIISKDGEILYQGTFE